MLFHTFEGFAAPVKFLGTEPSTTTLMITNTDDKSIYLTEFNVEFIHNKI